MRSSRGTVNLASAWSALSTSTPLLTEIAYSVPAFVVALWAYLISAAPCVASTQGRAYLAGCKTLACKTKHDMHLFEYRSVG